MKQQTLLRGRRGVMLIDAMIGIIMLALVAMIFAAALNGAALSRGMADGQTKAVIILGRQMESIRNVGYANLNYTSLLYYGLIDGSSTTSPYSFTNAGQVISDQVSNILKDGAGNRADNGCYRYYPTSDRHRVVEFAHRDQVRQRDHPTGKPGLACFIHNDSGLGSNHQMSRAFLTTSRSRAGTSLIEVLISLSIIVMIAYGTSMLLVNCSHSSDHIQTQSELDSKAAMAAEMIRGYLAEARAFTIAPNGRSISYQYPQSATGTYILSSTELDPTVHSIYLDGTGSNLYCSDDPNTPILQNIPAVDPEQNTTMFIFSSGCNTNEIVVRLVSSQNVDDNALYSAVTMRVYPRNMP